MTYLITTPVPTILRPPAFEYIDEARQRGALSPMQQHWLSTKRNDAAPDEAAAKKQRPAEKEFPMHKMAPLKREKEASPDTRFQLYNNGSPEAFRSPELEAVVPRGLDAAEEDAEEILVRMRHCNEWYKPQMMENGPRHDVFIDHSPPFYNPEYAHTAHPSSHPPAHPASHPSAHPPHPHMEGSFFSSYPSHPSPPHHNHNSNNSPNPNLNPNLNPSPNPANINGLNLSLGSPKGSLRHILDGQQVVLPILPPPPFFDHQHKRRMYEDEFRFESDEDFLRKKKKAKKEFRPKFAGEEAVIQREINSGGLCFKTHKPKIQREYYYSKLSKTIFRWTCCGSQAKTHPDS